MSADLTVVRVSVAAKVVRTVMITALAVKRAKKDWTLLCIVRFVGFWSGVNNVLRYVARKQNSTVSERIFVVWIWKCVR